MKYSIDKSLPAGERFRREVAPDRVSGPKVPVRGGAPALSFAVHSRALDALPAASVITDMTERILYVNAAFTNVTGFSSSDALGRNCSLLEGPETDPQAAAAFRAALARGETHRGEILNYRKDGTTFWNALTVSPLRNGNGDITHFVSVQRDVTAQRNLQDRLRFLALQGPLTDLANRTALEQYLSIRNGPPAAAEETAAPATAAAAVGIIDLDDFKAVNESFGHEAGDVLLAEFAQRLRGRLRDSDFVARLGGDEFVVVIENLDRDGAEEQLRPILQHLHQVVADEFVLGPAARVRVSMSMGLSLSPPDGDDRVALLRQADAALYRLKAHKNRRGQWWHLHTPDTPPATDGGRAPLVAGAETSGTGPQLPHAQGYRDRLFTGGLRMFFQPVVDLRSGKVHRLEALARLALEDGTVLPPAAFLPLLAEADSDLLFQAGLEQSLRQLAEWDILGHRLRVNLNLSPSTLLNPDCARWVASALSRHNIAPDRLVVELLEEPSDHSSVQNHVFNDILALGVGIAMDDLGVGHSSLRRLTAAAFSAVKIDRQILSQIKSSPIPTLTFLASMIQMGRDMGWHVVVEGLEDAGVTEAATIIGVPFGQGYHLARPMPAGDVLAWMRDFTAPPHAGDIRTLPGALAFHWKFTRLGSPHPGLLESCPLTALLAHADAEAAEWHGQQHMPTADHTESAAALLHWLTARVTGAHRA